MAFDIMNDDYSPEEIQELRIKHAKRMMIEPSISQAERDEWEKEFKKQTREAVKMKDNQFKMIMQSGGGQATVMESFINNTNPFDLLDSRGQ